MVRAVLLSPCISYCESRPCRDANSGLRVLGYTGWAAPCARHLLWGASEYQRLWHFPSVLCEMIEALDVSSLLGDASGAGQLHHLIFVFESIYWSAVPIANKCRS